MAGISILFRPFAWGYSFVMGFRNMLFDAGVLPERRFGVPVVTIGNLAVGGTGKTPHTEYLYNLLKSRGKVGILSRGYGRSTKGFRWVHPTSTVDECGDEPCQLKRKWGEAVVAVDENRCEGIQKMLETEKLAAIVLDDAYQHRYVKPDLNILLTDYHRLFSDDRVLPEGHLRESVSGRRRADFIIVTKCPADLKPIDFSLLEKRVAPFASQHLFFTTQQYSQPYPLFGEDRPFVGTNILAVTGISNPQTLVDHLKMYGDVTPLRFSDHHPFGDEDLAKINAAFSGHDAIITTEKDATRLVTVREKLSQEVRQALFVQPVEVSFLRDQAADFRRLAEERLFAVRK
ncbi:MAG: tetraacyldisaccharide 4'-kinase [Bacteroidaceae bacterium]|nr:tetraacyldisaccharide 4'-kinase [Bacteroidaceae bacterium]